MSEQLEQQLKVAAQSEGALHANLDNMLAEAADTLKRYREALAGLNAHIEAMQAMMVSYLKPGGDDQQAFIGNMIYMLDGPEQRAVQDRVRQALSDS